MDRKYNFSFFFFFALSRGALVTKCKTTSERFILTIVFRFHVSAHEIFILQQLRGCETKSRSLSRSGRFKRHFTLQLDALALCAASYFYLPGRRRLQAPHHRLRPPPAQFPPPHTFQQLCILKPKVEKPFQESRPASPPPESGTNKRRAAQHSAARE